MQSVHRLAALARLLGLGGVAGLLLAGALVPVVGVTGGLATRSLEGFESLPVTLRSPDLAQQTVIEAADGTPFATLYYQNRISVPLSQVAPIMQRAIIDTEDERFYQHHGVDVRGTLRSLVSTLTGRQVQGGSTITQQLVKQTLLASATDAASAAAATARTPARKLREARYALALERKFTKAQILESYLNIAYFGAGAYGIEAASRRYFSKPASELTLAEASLLAGLVQQPSGYDPLRHPQAATDRRSKVLRNMVRMHDITQAQADHVEQTRVVDIVHPASVPNGCTGSIAPFFCDYVMQTIRTDVAFGPTLAARDALLRTGGLHIRTSLSLQAQKAAQKAVDRTIPRNDPSRKAAAISLVQPGTGAIVAMAQNRLWGTSGVGMTTYNYNTNMAFSGTRGMQAGSTFKVFVLAAAMEKGLSPTEVINSPKTRTFTQFYGCGANGASLFPPYTVSNSTHSGRFNMYTGTAESVNTYFMALEQKTGICRPAEIAMSMGVTKADGSALEAVPSFVLGANEVSPLSLANAYATFAAHGLYCPAHAVLSITKADGTALPVPPTSCSQVIARGVADGVALMLRGVIDGNDPHRTGGTMALGRPAAGKTGTTDDSAAVWFCGFTPDLAGCAWAGDPRGGFKYKMSDIVINHVRYTPVYGASIPGPIWKATMQGALKGAPVVQFDLKPVLGNGVIEGPAACGPATSSCPASSDTATATPSATPGVPAGPTPTMSPSLSH